MGKSFKGTTGMSPRGQFIPARSRSIAAPPLPFWEMAAGILILFVINLVAIAAFLASVAQAVAQEATMGATAKGAAIVPVFVTPGEMRSGALLLKSENAALASEASGQRGNSMVRAPDTRPEAGSSA